jgi:hypothetical protein
MLLAPAGTTSANHPRTLNPGRPDSAIVGKSAEYTMNIFYIIGVVVVVVAGFLGLRV